MPDLEKHRNILMTCFQADRDRIDLLFSECNRSMKKTLHRFFLPDDSIEVLLDELQSVDHADDQKAIGLIDAFFHHHIPNQRFNSFLQWVKDERVDLDRETKLGLKAYKRVPRKIHLEQFFKIVQSFSHIVIAHSLKCLIPFGKQCDDHWMYIEYFMHSRSVEQIKMAIRLLQYMPKGYPKSARRFNLYMENMPLRIEILKTLMNRFDLSTSLVKYIVESCIDEYRRLSISDGYGNELLIEFNMIRKIYANYGLPITLPDIKI